MKLAKQPWGSETQTLPVSLHQEVQGPWEIPSISFSFIICPPSFGSVPDRQFDLRWSLDLDSFLETQGAGNFLKTLQILNALGMVNLILRFVSYESSSHYCRAVIFPLP